MINQVSSLKWLERKIMNKINLKFKTIFAFQVLYTQIKK